MHCKCIIIIMHRARNSSRAPVKCCTTSDPVSLCTRLASAGQGMSQTPGAECRASVGDDHAACNLVEVEGDCDTAEDCEWVAQGSLISTLRPLSRESLVGVDTAH